MRARLGGAIVAASLSALLSAGCSPLSSDSRPIPPGRYVGQPGGDVIEVSETELRFLLSGTPHEPKRRTDRVYQYTVLSDRRIQPYPMASEDALYGVGAWDWRWNGAAIEQRDLRSGSTIQRFTKAEP
jgi:hypothetical protein